MLHMITQRTDILAALAIDLISLLYIKVTYTLHLSSQFSQDLE